MKKIEPDVEVKTIVLKSVAQKILELPFDSIVLATRSGRSLDSVLHRTGPSGWLITRRPPDFPTPNPRGYFNNEQMLDWVDWHTSSGSTFCLIREGLGEPL